jgi:SH3 domain protein
MPTLTRIFLCLGIVFLGPISLWAKTMYITDRIEVGLRSGTGIEQRIITMLKTGDPVEWLEGDKNWSKIRLADKTVGWIATRFLVDQVKPTSIGNPNLQEEIKGLKEKNQNLMKEKELLSQEKSKLSVEIKGLAQTLQQERAAAPAAELATFKAKNEELSKEISTYKKQLTDISPKGQGQPKEDKVKWFLAGALVLCLGIILGWVFSRSRRRPKRYY